MGPLRTETKVERRHGGLYMDQFSSRFDFEGSPEPTNFVIIASTPRSGSHMLGHSLIEAGAFGVPFEYCNERNLREWQRRLGTSGLEATINALKRRRTTPNGVFSVKLHYRHLAQFGSFRLLLEVFPGAKFVRIERSDLLKQAISYSVARRTGVWIEGQQGNGATPRYSYEAVDRCLRELAQDNASWSYDLAKHGCPVLHLDFAEVGLDIPGTIAKLAAFCGVTPDRIPDRPPTRRQSTDERTAKWASAYLAEADASSLLRPPDRVRGSVSSLLRWRERLAT